MLLATMLHAISLIIQRIQNTTKQQYKSITINRNDLNLAYAKHKYNIIQYGKHT